MPSNFQGFAVKSDQNKHGRLWLCEMIDHGLICCLAHFLPADLFLLTTSKEITERDQRSIETTSGLGTCLYRLHVAPCKI